MYTSKYTLVLCSITILYIFIKYKIKYISYLENTKYNLLLLLLFVSKSNVPNTSSSIFQIFNLYISILLLF